MITTASQRGKPQPHVLHRDFSSPTLKSWRRKQFLQCEMEAGKRKSETRSPSLNNRLPLPRIGDLMIGDDDSSLKDLREKLLGHLRETANKMKIEMPPIGPAALALEKDDEPKLESEPLPATEETEKPWNLRLRTNAKTSEAPVASPAKTSERTMRLRSERLEKEKKPRFSISLSREEIEEDVFALTGSRPRRRPKKRPRNVQWQLDALFPGVNLPEITPELYKVDE